MSNQFELTERLLAVAIKDKAKWVTAAKREGKKADDFSEDREETCLVCANAVDQVVRKMEREVRLARYAAQGIEAATAAETVKLGSVHESPVGEADAPERCSEHSIHSSSGRG